MDAAKTSDDAGVAQRREGMRLLARATLGELSLAWDAIDDKPEVAPVRGPETGLVMVRGKIGGAAILSISARPPFHAPPCAFDRRGRPWAAARHRQGTRRLAAIFDALFQSAAHRASVEALHEQVAARLDAEDRRKAEETAATRVDFFTMVRGED